MHEHFDTRDSPHECSRRASMIEVHVREQDLSDIAEPDALRSEFELERLQTRRRPGIDERDASCRADYGGCNNVRAAPEMKVDPGKTRREDGHAKRGIILGSRRSC